VNISYLDRGNRESLDNSIYIILFYTAAMCPVVLLSQYGILHRSLRSCLFRDMSDSVGLPPFLILSLFVPFYELDTFCFLCGVFPLFMVELFAYRYRPYLVTSLVYFCPILIFPISLFTSDRRHERSLLASVLMPWPVGKASGPGPSPPCRTRRSRPIMTGISVRRAFFPRPRRTPNDAALTRKPGGSRPTRRSRPIVTGEFYQTPPFSAPPARAE
jgi:hypothetical protein